MQNIEILNLFGPAILTVLLNIGFYLIIKSNTDKKIEQNKIIYSGIFQEKLLLYREIMKYIADLKKEIFGLAISSDKRDVEKVQNMIWDYTYFNTINEVFWSERMTQNLIELGNKFDLITDELLSILNEKEDGKITDQEFKKKMNKAHQYILKNQMFNGYIKEMVEEMRADLQVKSFNAFT